VKQKGEKEAQGGRSSGPVRKAYANLEALAILAGGEGTKSDPEQFCGRRLLASCWQPPTQGDHLWGEKGKTLFHGKFRESVRRREERKREDLKKGEAGVAGGSAHHFPKRNIPRGKGLHAKDL